MVSQRTRNEFIEIIHANREKGKAVNAGEINQRSERLFLEDDVLERIPHLACLIKSERIGETNDNEWLVSCRALDLARHGNTP